MQTLSFDKDVAVKEYSAADKKTKAALTKIFGDKFFLSLTDRIKTWEDAAAEKGIDPVKSLPFQKPSNTREEAVNAFFMLDVIAELLCDGVVLDWTDTNQKKWYPWFTDYKKGSGFRFGGSGYNWTLTDTAGGARLCLPTKELTDYFGKQFLSTWNKFLNPNK